jgi:hypothetical protein
VFSGNVATPQTNPLFEIPITTAFWDVVFQAHPDVIPVFDTLMMGINAQLQGNPMNMFDVGLTGSMASTSIGGNDVVPIGANNATGHSFQQGGEWFHQSGSNSSTVTTPSLGGFLPPTSIGN